MHEGGDNAAQGEGQIEHVSHHKTNTERKEIVFLCALCLFRTQFSVKSGGLEA